jgi:hypothetical protein
MHLDAAVVDNHLDAPELEHKLDPSFFMSHDDAILGTLPAEWKDVMTPSPGIRPWTVAELGEIDCARWSVQCPGWDDTVRPCKQTHGSTGAASQRWKMFLQTGLKDYAKLRNQIQKPGCVSRISCYLNFGILSIFQVAWDLRKFRSEKCGSVGADKYHEEVIKWREMAYAHAFSTEHYDEVVSVPNWARECFVHQQDGMALFSLERLETGETADATWNAMQKYLRHTGELHNNARMTWGKTLVHWHKDGVSCAETLRRICYLNDRLALDGLSPPRFDDAHYPTLTYLVLLCPILYLLEF